MSQSAMSLGGYVTWAIAMLLSLHVWAVGVGQILWKMISKCADVDPCRPPAAPLACARAPATCHDLHAWSSC